MRNFLALYKMGMDNEPPRRQEHQELNFSMKRDVSAGREAFL
ncbi:MAG: hypothetical protein N2235_12580 [Fischerella sp.]|nr:hypothetical protein [Fischerella sp.]